MQAIDLLLQRQSARKLTTPAPDEATLRLIFDSAVRAPDHGRLRPWRFIVIGTEQRMQFGALLAGHLQRTRQSASAGDLERAQTKALRAPTIVVVAAIIAPESKVPPIEQILSAGAAAQNILLGALALGFNAVWKTGSAAYDEVVKAGLGLQPRDAIVGFIYIGTEAAELSAVARPPSAEFVVHWRAT